MAEEIRQRITLEGAELIEAQLREVALQEEVLAQKQEEVGNSADQAASKLDRHNQATKDLGKNAKATADDSTKFAQETDKAGEAAADNSSKVDRAAKSQNSLAGAIKGSISSWVGWTAVISTAVTVLRDVFDVAGKASDAVKKLGNDLNTLAVNQGGKVADETIKDINAIARTQSLNVSGRNELINAAGTFTDLNPNISQDALREQITNVARLRKVAGEAAGSGSDAASLLNTAQAKGNLSPSEAVNQVGSLLTSGFNQQTVGELYRRGDQDLIAAVYGARGNGLDLGRAASSLPQIMGALDRRDAQGQLSPDLLAAGVNSEMSTVQRLQAVQQARQAGRITPTQSLSLLGGYEAMDVAGPLMQSISPEALQAAKDEIRSSSLDQLAKRRNESRYVQAADAGANRELREQLALEQSKLSGIGGRQEEFNTQMTEAGGGSFYAGLLLELARKSQGNPVVGLTEMAAEAFAGRYEPGNPYNSGSFNDDFARSAKPSVTHVHIAQQYNLSPDNESPFRAPNRGGLE